ncbi:2-amino-4-hydroxy-6-hydroxymethyldihydropteridine diphosphokinase [Marinobacter sp. X15-166B]|uniref:2-amino-4-hydroxy-6- hydroxymethyldihydropteridine diphosphokinase n=1 Tax=Marinobacter sp. X15-166B TaxID=1897620 RepID=UPI00085C06BD|nr:2-amino-4-hydroxy-6-hydroxymethyldihydropteridine diphosphokinase [Marinobacter sp. X15-166B]OEY66508.1 2-amino-4-hydroxy-6-hydroxymethyldihydropteridine diphosphokinase [Marinobacter sp. X15-166B]
MTQAAQVYISIGSNIDREHHVLAALDALADRFGELDISSVYESEAVGFDGSPFYNLVVGVKTELTVAGLTQFFKQLETSHGRRRNAPKFSARTLDLDILLYDDRVGRVDSVELPRAEILSNAFVLLPLAEIAPDRVHPVAQQTYRQLWQAYDRDQKLWPIPFCWRGRTISPL